MSVCDIPAISAVCETAGEAAATLVSAPFDWLATLGRAVGLGISRRRGAKRSITAPPSAETSRN
ncbi:hypothetical protein SAMN06298212_12919 [Ruaniaceae bacterium KH17]|nr:hypothetical protein SAMN06298212_12919 [Ruaniaceae bacterium KH17]